MNSDKTEVILFRSWQQIMKCRLLTLKVCGESIPYSESIKYLGICIDSNLCLHNHIASKCRTAMCNLFRIVNIRNFLTTEACHTTMLTTVISHFDYANAIMVGLPEKHCKAAACSEYGCKIVLKRGKYTSSKDSLQTLYWLPIRSQINFKIVVLVYKCLHGKAPENLQNLLITNVPGRVSDLKQSLIDLLCLELKKKNICR